MLNKELKKKVEKAKLESPLIKKIRKNSLYILSGAIVCTSLGFGVGATVTANETVRSVEDLKPMLQPMTLDDLRERDGEDFKKQEENYDAEETQRAIEKQQKQEIVTQGATVQNMSTEQVKEYAEDIYQITAYTADKECSGNWGRQTSTGNTATEGRTVAVDPDYIPYGTKIEIDGVVYTAEDCGGKVKGKVIDIFMNDLSEAKEFGRQTKTVKIYR